MPKVLRRSLLPLLAALLSFVPLVPAVARPAGAIEWVADYDGPDSHFPADIDHLVDLVVSPDGTRVFEAGASAGRDGDRDYATVSYDVRTGHERWVRRFDGRAHGLDEPAALAVSPDGGTVVVTGSSPGVGTDWDILTIAYDATTGATRWTRREDGGTGGVDIGTDVVVSADGETVFVTGMTVATDTYGDAVTVAYDIATGDRRWEQRYVGSLAQPGAAGLVVAADVGRVFVSADSRQSSGASSDFVTIAYDARTGDQLWRRRYDGPAHDFDGARALLVAPDGRTLYTTGQSTSATGPDIVTIAYRTGTGDRRWLVRYNDPHDGDDYGNDAALTPDGGTLVVTGGSAGSTDCTDMFTIAYATATGDPLWTRRSSGAGDGCDEGTATAVSPDGRHVYVTGDTLGAFQELAVATLAYDVPTGEKLWGARYDAPAHQGDLSAAVAVGDDGRSVVVGASSFVGPMDIDFVTIAYRAKR